MSVTARFSLWLLVNERFYSQLNSHLKENAEGNESEEVGELNRASDCNSVSDCTCTLAFQDCLKAEPYGSPSFKENFPEQEGSFVEAIATDLELGWQWQQEREMLLRELAQKRSLDEKRLERICHLEQVLDQSLSYLSELRLQVQDQQALETQLATTEEFSQVQQQAIVQLRAQLAEQQQALDVQPQEPKTTPTLQQDLVAAHIKLEELETQVMEQAIIKSRLQHTCQELKGERDRHHLQNAELKQQVADLQEQVLKQACQANEHETAAQHWKDRFLTSQYHALRLHQLLQPLLAAGSAASCTAKQPTSPETLLGKTETQSTLSPNEVAELKTCLIELLRILQSPPMFSSSASACRDSTALPQSDKLRIPAFLLHRRKYQAK